MIHNDTHSNKELFVRIAQGSEEAFALFFREFSPILRMQAATFVKDSFGITEVLQESFIKIWLHREKLPEVTHIQAYLKKIVLNESFDYLNKLARQEKLHQAETAIPVISAEDHLSFKETRDIIQEAIRNLPPQRRTIYQLSRNEGLTSIEIGQQLGISPDYARRAIAAARQSIKTLLIQAGKVLAVLWGLF